MCQTLNIRRSSYYKWFQRDKTKNELENEEYGRLILDYDTRFEHILGYRRMTTWINRLNHKHANRKRIKRLMDLMGIHSIIRRKKSQFQKSTPEITAENLVDRDFKVDQPNEKWLTDITEFKVIGTPQKLYLSAIIDLYDNSIVAYQMSTHSNNQLVFDTFEAAIAKYPDAKPIFHSDRGFQYTNRVFRFKLDEMGMTQSMSRIGRCIDNGPMESFWGTLKSEMYYLRKFHSFSELREAIVEYLDFYNYRRFQVKLKNMAPMEYRSHAYQTNQ
jgi:putative transposase